MSCWHQRSIEETQHFLFRNYTTLAPRVTLDQGRSDRPIQYGRKIHRVRRRFSSINHSSGGPYHREHNSDESIRNTRGWNSGRAPPLAADMVEREIEIANLRAVIGKVRNKFGPRRTPSACRRRMIMSLGYRERHRVAPIAGARKRQEIRAHREHGYGHHYRCLRGVRFQRTVDS